MTPIATALAEFPQRPAPPGLPTGVHIKAQPWEARGHGETMSTRVKCREIGSITLQETLQSRSLVPRDGGLWRHLAVGRTTLGEYTRLGPSARLGPTFVVREGNVGNKATGKSHRKKSPK